MNGLPSRVAYSRSAQMLSLQRDRADAEKTGTPHEQLFDHGTACFMAHGWSNLRTQSDNPVYLPSVMST